MITVTVPYWGLTWAAISVAVAEVFIRNILFKLYSELYRRK